MGERTFKKYVRDKLPDLHFDVLLRCWDLPQLNAHLAGCCGSHYDLLRMLSIKHSVHKHIKTCQTKVDDLISQQKDVVRVACCDSHGIHRSYAMATLLQGICEAKNDYISEGPHHMDAEQWAATVCTRCNSCLPSDERDLLYARKVVYW